MSNVQTQLRKSESFKHWYKPSTFQAHIDMSQCSSLSQFSLLEVAPVGLDLNLEY